MALGDKPPEQGAAPRWWAPRYDLTIMDFDRWGMGRAVATLRDTSEDGMNIMHRLPDRPDWIAPFPDRAHHANWCADVTHPDMRLMAAAPDLLEALQEVVAISDRKHDAWDKAHAAIAKALGHNVELTGLRPQGATNDN